MYDRDAFSITSKDGLNLTNAKKNHVYTTLNTYKRLYTHDLMTHNKISQQPIYIIIARKENSQLNL
jgi:hypothetical protein